MRSYSELVRVREEEVEELGPWTWVASDTGAWDGPVNDWLESHSKRYFEFVKKYDVCVQAGGNQGLYPRLLAKRFKTVYTFEPDPLNFYCLVQNCQEDNIVKFQAALGSCREMLSVARNNMQNVGMHTVHRNAEGIIPSLMLDDFELPTLDLLCLDIEGFEENALIGAQFTISRHKPVIVVENPRDSIDEMLLEFGYHREHVRSKTDGIYHCP